MTWQEYVREQAAFLGLTVSSGYRDPAHNRAVGGAAHSLHMTGSPDAPGAMDVSGPADKLRALFDDVRIFFKGRVTELYLNVPGGQSEDVRHNQSISSNPEAGRPQHLHIAIGSGAAPASAIPEGNRGDKARGDTGGCVRQICPPDFPGMIARALHQEAPVQSNCICWSDVWVYGVAVLLILGGGFLVAGGRK